MITLRAQPLTAPGFAAFGSVIGTAGAASLAGGKGTATAATTAATATVSAINGGSAQRHEALAAMQLQASGGRAVLSVYDATPRAFPFEARLLERHRLSDQVFLPLGGARRCVLLVAPAGLAQPRAADCSAFVTDGQQGVCIAAGTWHHSLLALDAGPWAVLERRADAPDCDEWPLDMPLHLSLHPTLAPAPPA